MEAPIVDNEPWLSVESSLPPAKPRARSDPDRPRASDRAALDGMLFVFKTGFRWNYSPTRLGFGSGATCRQSVWDKRHALLPDTLCAAGRIDLLYAASDSLAVRAVLAGEKLVRISPIGRDWPKHHILVTANGVPVVAIPSGTNANGATQLPLRVAALASIRGVRGRPLQTPGVVYADRGYASTWHRRAPCARDIRPVIARRRTEPGSGLGKYRWVAHARLAS